jgi:hypothetical protein
MRELNKNILEKKAQVYLAAPFGSKATNLSDREYGEIVDIHYICFLEAIENVLLEEGLEVHLPHRVILFPALALRLLKEWLIRA